ncbi:MAG TPA: cyclic-di-AMP receptor [Anaerolineales bacterium]
MTKPTEDVNQLVMLVVLERQAENLLPALSKEHFYFTKIDSSGMVFQETTLCLLIGLNNSRLTGLLGLVTEYCQPREEYVPVQFNPPVGFAPFPMIEARIGGALIYVLDVDRFEQV